MSPSAYPVEEKVGAALKLWAGTPVDEDDDDGELFDEPPHADAASVRMARPTGANSDADTL